MIRPTKTCNASTRHGMRRSTRVSIVAGVAIFLTLVSGVSFAAWNASSVKTSNASAGNVALTTAVTGNTSTISALGGPHTYTASSPTVTKPITIRNTGTVSASLSTLEISSSGTLAGNQVAVKLWVGSSASCGTAPSNIVSTSLLSTTPASGPISLSSLGMTVTASGSATLCASTTFTGNMTSQAGRSISAIFTLKSSAGTNWIATDAATAASRTFVQRIEEIPQLSAPTGMSCTTVAGGWFQLDRARISWVAPSANNVTYNVYFTNASGTVALSSTTSTTTTITSSQISSNGAVTVIASAPGFTDSPSSAPTALTYSPPWWTSDGDVRCG